MSYRSWTLGWALLGLTFLALAGGCFGPERQYFRSPKAPVAPKPKVTQTTSRDTHVVAVTLEGSDLRPTQPGGDTIRHGHVTMRMELIDKRTCAGRPSLFSTVDLPDQRRAGACLANPFSKDRFLVGLTITNGLPHGIDLRRTPIVVRFRDGSIDFPRLAHLPKALATEVTPIEASWDVPKDGPPVLMALDPARQFSGGATYVDVERLPDEFLSPLRDLPGLDVRRKLLPGETRTGWFSIRVPDRMLEGESFTLGIYDVVVQTDAAARAASVTSFEFSLVRAPWTFVAQVERSKWVTTRVEEDPRKPPPPSLPTEASNLNELSLGSLDTVNAALPILQRWIGSIVTVRVRGGSETAGTLSGLQGTTVVVTMPGGSRWTQDLLEIERIQLVPGPVIGNTPRVP